MTKTDTIRCTDTRGTVIAKKGITMQGCAYLYLSTAVAKRWQGEPPAPPAPYRVWISTSDFPGLRAFEV